MKYLDELASLKLPKEQFAIFGSGPIAIRGIREPHDLDIIVKEKLWKLLSHKYPEFIKSNPLHLQIGNIKIYKDWPGLSKNIDTIIDEAETFYDFPYVALSYVIEYKKYFGRKKDLQDIQLIQHYSANDR